MSGPIRGESAPRSTFSKQDGAEDHSNGSRKKKGSPLTPNQKLLLRLAQHPNRVVRLLLVLDGKGQVQIANVEDVGKAERFG